MPAATELVVVATHHIIAEASTILSLIYYVSIAFSMVNRGLLGITIALRIV